jgi:hypothetical protein
MEMSLHASMRCQQRGIPPLIRQWLQDFGSEVATHGATKRYFDRRAKKRLTAAVAAQVVDRLGGLLNVYIVEGDEQVITAGHRTRRIKQR